MKIKRKVLVTSAAAAILIGGGYFSQDDNITNLSPELVIQASEVQDNWQEDEMIDWVNNHRAEVSEEQGPTHPQGAYERMPLEYHDDLNAFAKWKAQDLAEKGYFSHDGPDGRSPSEQYIDYSIEHYGKPEFQRGIAENLTAYTGPEITQEEFDALAFSLWLNSDKGHREAMESLSYTDFGYASHRNQNYDPYNEDSYQWYGVQIFGSNSDKHFEILKENTHTVEGDTSDRPERYHTDPMVGYNKTYHASDINLDNYDDTHTDIPMDEPESNKDDGKEVTNPESDNKDKEQEETNQSGDNGQLDEDNQPELNNNDDDAGKDENSEDKENPESNKDNDNDEGTKEQPNEEQSPDSGVEEDSPDNDEDSNAEENSEVDETPEPDSDVEEEVSPDNDESPDAEENSKVDETPELESDKELDVPAVEEEIDTEESEVDFENNENSTEDGTEEDTELTVDGTNSDNESTLDLNIEESDDGDDSDESSESATKENNVDLNNDETDSNDESETVAVEKEYDGDAEAVDAEEESLPETGEAMSNNGFLFGAVALVAGFGLFLIGRRRPDNK